MALAHHQLFQGAGEIEMFQIRIQLPKRVRNLHSSGLHE